MPAHRDSRSPRWRAVYLARPGEPIAYQVGPPGRLVMEGANLFAVREAEILGSDGRRHRHALEVPVAMSAVSFAVGVALEEADSRAVEAGDEVGVRRLAAGVQHAYGRYRTFPLPWPPRFMPF